MSTYEILEALEVGDKVVVNMDVRYFPGKYRKATITTVTKGRIVTTDEHNINRTFNRRTGRQWGTSDSYHRPYIDWTGYSTRNIHLTTWEEIDELQAQEDARKNRKQNVRYVEQNTNSLSDEQLTQVVEWIKSNKA